MEVHSTAAPATDAAAEIIPPAVETGDREAPLAVDPAVSAAPPPPATMPAEDASTPATSPARPSEQHRPQQRAYSPDRPQHFQQRPASPPPAPRSRTLQQASQEVLAIIEQLNDVLCDMEHISKMLDDVEIQQRSDEKEIESLRNALRQFQNPPHQRQQPPRERERERDGGQSRGQPRHHDRYRQRNPQHYQQGPREPLPPRPPPEGQSASPQPPASQEDPEQHGPGTNELDREPSTT